LPESGEKYALDFDVRGQQMMDFFTGGRLVMNNGLVF